MLGNPILLQLAVIGIAVYVIWLFLYSLLFGAPYAAIGRKRLVAMLRLAHVRKGERAVDVGSGDGRIVIALAREGAHAEGFEINPLLHGIALWNIHKSKEKRARVFLKDLWQVNFSPYDIVTVYGNFPMMGRLEKKLQKELKPGARVISNHFAFPHWKSTKSSDDVLLYIKTV